ncbi:helix-turn-helix domain-containing protein [Escherichia coli]
MQLLVLLRKGSQEQGAMDNDARLNQLMAWLEEHFAEEVCWEGVADRFSLSLAALSRQLKHCTGLTPQRYLNRLRLIKARHLLRHSDESVTDIAYRCGFRELTTFRPFFAANLTGRRAIFARGGHPASVTRRESPFFASKRLMIESC